ncbi:hypothetical protein NC652_021802 [Populus alba x Populus x berolinensis]|nr:hypothetical protein NC652_021802 [Populus alba x Populus x berolinensis]
MEGDSNGENKPASDATEEEPCQPGQVGGGGCSRPKEVCVENKSTAGEDFNLEKVGENKVMAEEKLNLEEVSGDVEKTHLNDSMRTGPNSIEKGDGKEQDCNLGRILEPGCVSVDFRRTEASRIAGHCLHGKGMLLDHKPWKNQSNEAGYIIPNPTQVNTLTPIKIRGPKYSSSSCCCTFYPLLPIREAKAHNNQEAKQVRKFLTRLFWICYLIIMSSSILVTIRSLHNHYFNSNINKKNKRKRKGKGTQ